MRELIEKLNAYTRAYEKGESLISDKEWDDMYFQLKKMEDETGIIYADSPTQEIVYESVDSLRKVEHSHPMLSLDKTKDTEEIKKFMGDKECIVMAKMDGLTCSLLYHNGYLLRAETRGNGQVGEDVTHCALVVKNIPQRIPCEEDTVVDGEIICTYEDFESFKDDYKNPRNFAAGSIRLLDSRVCASRNLSFVAWDNITSNEETLSKKLFDLAQYGFTVVPYSTIEPDTLDDDIYCLKLSCQRQQYPIDGLVFKYNQVKEYEAAGRTSHHFKGGMALKFYDEEYETTLEDIEWSIGRSGVLTPVAIFDEIDDGDSKITRASLHNMNIKNDLLGTPFRGQKVWVAKQNMIIPQITRAEKKCYDGHDANALLIPQTCPYCGAPTDTITSDSGTVELYCSNKDQCQGILVNRIDHFVGKKGLDIKGLSEATIQKFIDWGWVDSIESIFNLPYDELEKKPGFGKKSVANIRNAIEDARATTLSKFISALGIPLIGKTYADGLGMVFPTWEEFKDAVDSGYDFSQLNGFGPAMNESLHNFNYEEAERIIKYLCFTFVMNEPSSDFFNGMTFVVTGSLKKHWHNRDELKKELTSYGAKVVETVSAKADYLINNDSTSKSSKNVKAQALGIEIINEDQLLALIEEGRRNES